MDFPAVLPEHKCDKVNTLYLNEWHGSLYTIFNHLLVMILCHYPHAMMVSGLISWLNKIYMQLYSGRECEVPSFYQKYGHRRIAGNLIDLDTPGPHNKAYAVIAAYWLRKGDN